MEFSLLCRQALLCAIGAVAAFGANGNTGNPFLEAGKPAGDRMDRSWKRYRNPERGYCINYPARWSRGSAFEGSGIFLQTGLRRYSQPAGEIDIGPLNADAPEDARLKLATTRDNDRMQDLQDSLREHLAGLKKFARAERMEIIDQHPFDVQGDRGLFLKNRYYDPLERAHWLEEVVFVHHNGDVYRLEMQCSPDQIKRFEPVFAYLVNSLEFDCKQ